MVVPSGAKHSTTRRERSKAMEKVYVAYYWYDRLGKWIEFYSSVDKEKCEWIAKMQREMGDMVKVEEKSNRRSK